MPNRSKALPERHLLMEEELPVLQELARGRAYCVDIGTYYGYSAALMAQVCGKVLTVDVFQPTEDGVRHWFEVNGYDNVTVLRSDGGIPVTMGTRPELVFIDADHSYEATLQQAHHWIPQLALGGVLVLHDCNAVHADIMNVAAKLRQDGRLKEIPSSSLAGSLAAFKKVAN